MSQGWPYTVDVEIDAPLDDVRHWLRRSLGRTEAIDEDHTRLLGTTENLYWYASKIAELPVPYKVVGGPEIREAVRNLAQRLADSLSPSRPDAELVAVGVGELDARVPVAEPGRAEGDQPLHLGRDVVER